MRMKVSLSLDDNVYHLVAQNIDSGSGSVFHFKAAEFKIFEILYKGVMREWWNVNDVTFEEGYYEEGYVRTVLNTLTAKFPQLVEKREGIVKSEYSSKLLNGYRLTDWAWEILRELHHPTCSEELSYPEEPIVDNVKLDMPAAPNFALTGDVIAEINIPCAQEGYAELKAQIEDACKEFAKNLEAIGKSDGRTPEVAIYGNLVFRN